MEITTKNDDAATTETARLLTPGWSRWKTTLTEFFVNIASYISLSHGEQLNTYTSIQSVLQSLAQPKVFRKGPHVLKIESESLTEKQIFSRLRQDIMSLNQWAWMGGAASLHLRSSNRLVIREAKDNMHPCHVIHLANSTKKVNQKVGLQFEIYDLG